MTLQELKNPNKTPNNLLVMGVLTLLFLLILAPFWENGLGKCFSVAIILGFFSQILLNITKEYYAFLEYLNTRNKQSQINRVTGKQILNENDKVTVTQKSY